MAKQLRLPERLRVYVTASDIRKGRPGSYCHCPIALATQRAVARAGFDPSTSIGVTTGLLKLRFPQPGSADFWPQYTYALPGKATEFITKFDRVGSGRDALKPFRFEARR